LEPYLKITRAVIAVGCEIEVVCGVPTSSRFRHRPFHTRRYGWRQVSCPDSREVGVQLHETTSSPTADAYKVSKVIQFTFIVSINCVCE